MELAALEHFKKIFYLLENYPKIFLWDAGSQVSDRCPLGYLFKNADFLNYANTSVQYTAIYHGCKTGNFQFKFWDFFLIFDQNIDCEYTLEPPLCFRAKIRKNVYPCKPQFYYIKVGCKGVFITRTCYHDVSFKYQVLLRFSQTSTPIDKLNITDIMERPFPLRSDCSVTQAKKNLHKWVFPELSLHGP